MQNSLTQQTDDRRNSLVQVPDGQAVCRLCGATTDLWVEPRYVGGHGYVLTTECRLIEACWARRERVT